MGDGLFVALARPAHWPLATPPQLAQNLPHVAVVVPNPKLLFDQMAYSPQRPQRRLVAQSLRPLQQTLLQPLQVFRTQTRLASGTAGLPKSLSSLLSQHSNPAVHAGVAHFQATGYFRLAQPLLQQSYRPQAAALQSLKISAYSLWVSHADIDASRVVLVALYYATLNKRGRHFPHIAVCGEENYEQKTLHSLTRRNRCCCAGNSAALKRRLPQ